MDRVRAGWTSLSGGWKVAFVLALAWLPISAMIVLSTTAVGEPLPTPIRLLDSVAWLIAFVIVITVVRKVLKAA